MIYSQTSQYVSYDKRSESSRLQSGLGREHAKVGVADASS